MLRLSDSLKWITHHRFHHVQDSEGGLSIGVDPVMQIIAALML